VTGPFTLAGHLRGTEIFMDSILNPDFLTELMAYTTQVVKRMAEMYIAAGMDVIAVVDPLVSQIGPHHFTQFCTGPFTEIFSAIRAQGALSSFFVCGDATKNLEVMCQTGPDSISIDENIDIAAAKQITDSDNITLVGNLPRTTTMLLGTQQDNMKYVVDLLDKLDHHNFVLAPGCDMPYDVPVENAIGVLDAVRHPERARQMLANYEAPTLDIAVQLPDYAHLACPLVEVFTLDSASCAACGYMKDAAIRVADELAGQIEMVEYKFTTVENVARMKKLGVKNLPAIYINGELKYSSIIPSNQEFIAEVKKYPG
jgi:uroporphyrinogen decarboxylase